MLVVNGKGHRVEHLNPRERWLDGDWFSGEGVAAGHVSDDAAGWTPLVVPKGGVGNFDKGDDRVEAGQKFEVRLSSVDRFVTDADGEVGLQKTPDYIVRRDRRTAWM